MMQYTLTKLNGIQVFFQHFKKPYVTLKTEVFKFSPLSLDTKVVSKSEILLLYFLFIVQEGKHFQEAISL